MFLKIGFFLILFVHVLKVKSDKSFLPSERQGLDAVAETLQNSPYRNQMIQQTEFGINGLEITPEQEAQERNIISQLTNLVNERKNLIQQGQQHISIKLIAREQLIQDQQTLNRLDQALISTKTRIEEQLTREPLVPEQRARNRRAIIQRLQELNNHLGNVLDRYILARRIQELKELNKFIENLDVIKRNEMQQRAKENIAHDQIAQGEQHKLDRLDQLIRAKAQIIQQRHAQKQPIDEQHAAHVSDLKKLWQELNLQTQVVERRRKQREQEKLLLERRIQQEILQRQAITNVAMPFRPNGQFQDQSRTRGQARGNERNYGFGKNNR